MISTNLSEEQTKELVNNISDLPLDELNSILFEIQKNDYEEMPVDIETFINDPYYLGATYGNKVYNIWVKTLKEIFPIPLYSPVYEVILSACIGAGKTTCSIIGILYDIHKLFCLKNPQEHYGLTPNTTIAFSLFSATLSLAQDVNWNSLVDAVRNSPYFMNKLVDRKAVDVKAKTSMIMLAKNIGIQIGSNFKHTIGKAVFGSLLDEASFQSKTTENDQAQNTYNALTSRAESRFADSVLLNPLPGHQWLASSPFCATDFLAQKIAKAEGKRGILVKQNIALWDAKTNLMSGDYFYVYVGSRENPSEILDSLDGFPEDKLSDVHKVPSIFRQSFEDDLELNIMDKLGRSVGGISNLIKDVRPLRKAMVIKNPVKKTIIDDLSFAGSDQIIDYLDKNYFSNLNEPTSNRFIMLDAATTGDTYGIASVYCKPTSSDTSNETAYEYNNRLYFNDFIIGIKARKGERINYSKVKNFIMYLVMEKGYPLAMVGADQFQSEDMLQYFTLKGFDTKRVSVVTDPTIYEGARDSFESEKFYLVNHERVYEEFANLRKIYTNAKVGKGGVLRQYMYDHPASGSKDLTDAITGAWYLCKSSNNIINRAKAVIDYYNVPDSQKDEDYYSNLTDDEFLEELKNNS